MRPTGIKRVFRFWSRSARDVRRDVRDELSFHIEMRAGELEARGLDPAAARAQALSEFGDLGRASAAISRVDERVNRQRGLTRFVADLRQDLTLGLRMIVRNRAFSTAAVLTLSLAIGGNTAIFSVINALFLQPLPVRAPQELARIYTGESTASWPNVDDIRRRNAVFADVIAQGNADVSMAADPLPVRVRTGLVSMNYFSVLGTPPLVGSVPRPEDVRANVVVLSERLWRNRFGGLTSIVGQPIIIGGHSYDVLGVMPRAFRGVAPAGLSPEMWMPVDTQGLHLGLARDRGATRFEVFGRLRPGASIEEAAAAMRVLGAQLAVEHPEADNRFGATEVFALSGAGLYRGVGKTLLPVFAFLGFLTLVAGFVLLISCANLAGLLLGRAAARRQEIAVRIALGAGRGRLVRQLLTESLLLAFMGGAGGLGLAILLTVGLARLTRALPISIDLDATPDLRVLGFTCLVSVCCAVLFGLAPARRAARVSLAGSLKTNGSDGSTRQRFRQALIVAQVAVSALLLFWSGLFARSVLQVNSVDPGFDASGVVLADVELGDDKPDALLRAEAAYVELQQRVSAYPGVDVAVWASVVPLALTSNERFRVSRADTPQGTPGQWIVSNRLSPGWFAAVRIPFVAGRDFTWQDRAGSPLVVIVNETLARQFWNGDALGRRLAYGSTFSEVVGVVRDSKYWTLGEQTAPTVYRPFRQVPAGWPQTLHIRTTSPRETAERLRRDAAELVPGAAPSLQPMREAVAVAVVPARVGAAVTGAFGLLGALLATLGVYGLISYVVVQRSREIAIRRAIGAQARHILWEVVGTSAALAAAGLGVGLAAGALSAPLLGSLLVNVSPTDPLTLVATAFVVIGTTVLASAPPALRATRLEPLAALNAD